MYLIFAAFVAYGINLSVLIGSVAYISYSFLSKVYLKFENPLLKGWRLLMAFILCCLWTFYVASDLMSTLSYLDKYYSNMDLSMMNAKVIRVWIDCIGTILNVILLTGKGIKK